MRLDGALSIATGGLANVNRQMAIVSQNVANASTPGYASEVATQTSVTADGEGLGVRSGPAIRNLDAMLQAEVFRQNAAVAGLQTQQTALQSIDAVQGVPGQGNDIASLLGNMQDQFSTLLNNPDNAPQQSQVVQSAVTLAQGINTLSNAYVAQRQTAEDNIVTEVATLNATLGTVGELSNKIVTLKVGDHSTADLENQRDAALARLSQLLDIKVLGQPNGDLLIATTAGLVLPIHGATNPFTADGANVQPNRCAPRWADWCQYRTTRYHPADRPGGTGRIRAEPCRPVQRLRPDAVHPARRNAADECAAAGAERLCWLCRQHPGQSGGAVRSIDRARWRRPAGAGARRLHRHH